MNSSALVRLVDIAGAAHHRRNACLLDSPPPCRKRPFAVAVLAGELYWPAASPRHPPPVLAPRIRASRYTKPACGRDFLHLGLENFLAVVDQLRSPCIGLVGRQHAELELEGRDVRYDVERGAPSGSRVPGRERHIARARRACRRRIGRQCRDAGRSPARHIPCIDRPAARARWQVRPWTVTLNERFPCADQTSISVGSPTKHAFAAPAPRRSSGSCGARPSNRLLYRRTQMQRLLQRAL